LLPGPEATQLATYVGWLMHGTAGGLLAGVLFVLPGFLAILALSIVYVTAGHLAPVTGLLFGLKAAILAIVVDAVLRTGLPPLAATGRVAARWLALWILPVAALAVGLGRGHVLVRLGEFFSEAAVVTFGGAYAVLAYVAQRAVGDFGWLTPREMVDGLALAE